MTTRLDGETEFRRANAELERRLNEALARETTIAEGLRANEERHLLVTQAVAEGIYDWDIESNTLWVSPRLIEIFGLTGESVTAADWNERVLPDDFEYYRASLRDCFKATTPRLDCEYRIRYGDDQYRWIEDRGVPVRDETGRAVRLVGAVSDITRRKEAEEILRETNRFKDRLLDDLNAVIETIDYGVLFMGPDLRARVVNRAFRQMWNIPEAFIASRPTMADLINFNRYTGLYNVPEAEFDAFIARRVKAIQSGDIAPMEMHRADGKFLRYGGIVLPDGGRLLTYFDITQAKSREAELRDTLEQQTATAEVLQVINSSPGDLRPVFNAMLEKALRLCGASFGELRTYDGERFFLAATHGVPAAYTEYYSRHDTGHYGSETGPARLLAGERVIHISDLIATEPYQQGDPDRLALVDLAGARAYVLVPLLSQEAVRGFILIYRREPRPFTDKQIALLQNFAAQAVIAMENARLITETREALEQQTATAEVLGVINSSPGDLAPVFDAILEKAHRLCDAAQGTLLLYDGEKFRAVAGHGYVEALTDRLRQPYELGLNNPMRPLLGGARVVQIPDLADIDDPVAQSVTKLGGYRTTLFVPLRKDGSLLGVITAARTEIRPFTTEQIALLQNFAAQAVIAMENARLITETREALAQQTATAEVLGVINSSPGDLAPVFQEIVDKAVTLSGAAEGALRTFDGRLFHLVAMNGGDPEGIERVRQLGPIPPISYYEPIARGQPVVQVADWRETDEYRNDPAMRERADLRGLRTSLAVSLQKEGVVLGAILVHRKEVKPFTEKEIALLQNFAAQAVIAMENARLITETREALEQQTATSEVLAACRTRVFG